MRSGTRPGNLTKPDESVWSHVSFFKWWEVVGAEAHFRV